MTTRLDLEEQGYKPYEGEGITIFWQPKACRHAQRCIHGDPEVFDVERRPWIDPNANTPEHIASVIDTCPSGALRYIRSGETEANPFPETGTEGFH